MLTAQLLFELDQVNIVFNLAAPQPFIEIFLYFRILLFFVCVFHFVADKYVEIISIYRI